MRLNFLSVFALVGGLFQAAPVAAANLLATSYLSEQSFSESGKLKIAKSGAVSQTFVAPAGQTIMISFSAVCSNFGLDYKATRIQIIVNGNIVSPTDSPSNIFCSANGRISSHDSKSVNTIITSLTTGSSPSNSLSIKVIPINGSTSVLDDVVINVWN